MNTAMNTYARRSRSEDGRGRAAGRRGFSLVELLVIVGIIAVLVGLLMPALSAAQERARQVRCLTQLRSVGQAIRYHEIDHDGYLPLAGWHWKLPKKVADPAGLGDSRERRYTYYIDNGIKRPAPITVALGQYMGASVRTESREALAEDLRQSDGLRRLFHCPSQQVQLSGWTQRGDEGAWTSPDEYSSYVFNEALLGRRDKDDTDISVMGKTTRAHRPTEVFFAMDGRPRDQNLDRWLMVFNWGREDTVYDFDRQIRQAGLGKELLDFWRHKMKANVVFLDGHAETIPMGPEGLKLIGVSKGLYE